MTREYTLRDQVACAKREIAMRERVYPKWVSAQKMRANEAEHETGAMKAILATLTRLAAEEEAKRGAAETINNEGF